MRESWWKGIILAMSSRFPPWIVVKGSNFLHTHLTTSTFPWPPLYRTHLYTSHPLLSEFIAIENNLTPEYLPPPGSDLERVPLHSAPPTNPDAPSDPSTNAAYPSICSPHTSMQDTPSSQPLPPEFPVSSNNKNPLSAGNDFSHFLREVCTKLPLPVYIFLHSRSCV